MARRRDIPHYLALDPVVCAVRACLDDAWESAYHVSVTPTPIDGVRTWCVLVCVNEERVDACGELLGAHAEINRLGALHEVTVVVEPFFDTSTLWG